MLKYLKKRDSFLRTTLGLFRWPIRKKELYIHIGMGKTGTSALQKFFWSNKNLLSKQYNICYPDLGVVSGAQHLLSPHVPVYLKDMGMFRDVDEWAPKLAKVKEQIILLSSELMASCKEDRVLSFCASISTWFDPRIVIYFRRQDNLIMAGYNQQIKAGTRKRDIHTELWSQFNRLDYGKILSPWNSILGEKNIIVRPYEKGQFYGDDIRKDFMYHVFGIKLNDEFTINHNNLNPRFAFAAMEYKRILNNLIQDTRILSKFNKILLQYSARIDESSYSIFSDQALLSPSDRIEILKRSEPVNIMVAHRYLNRKDGCLFYEPYPEINEKWIKRELSEQEMIDITTCIQEKNPELIKVIIDSLDVALASKNSSIVQFVKMMKKLMNT